MRKVIANSPVYFLQIIFQYIRENVDSFPLDILKRLTIQLDPSQPCAIPFLRAIYQNNKSSSTTDANIESFDYETADTCIVVMKDLVETFLYVILNLTGRFSRIRSEITLNFQNKILYSFFYAWNLRTL